MIPLKTPPSTRTQAITTPPPTPSPLRKRFSPQETTTPDGSSELAFKLRPSDPDFPFELAHLDCRLRVPKTYPEQRPVLRVANGNLPRGFAINVERGWDGLVREREGATLLTLIRDISTPPGLGPESPPEATPEPKAAPRPPLAERVFTKEQMADAKAKRALQVRQLEARMGRMPAFRRSADGVVFTLPIEPKRREDLSSGLRSVCTLHLIVPLLYPLQHPRIQLNEADADAAEAVEELFAQKAASQEMLSLTGHLNYLALNLGNLDRQAQAAKAETEKQTVSPRPQGARDAGGAPPAAAAEGGDKGHIQVIARPPEWTMDESEHGWSDSSSEDDVSDADEGQDSTEHSRQEWPQRGTLMTLPSMELQGIELLEIQTLSIGVKCNRCRTRNETTGLKPGAETSSSCSKCTAPLTATFHPQLLHHGSNRACWIDVTGVRAWSPCQASA
ncbi:CHY zinc finger domain protein [Ophiocordyceps camponoti-floridani]|uniref:CHY zinc finger domain protein n=1 Tax=Ophiocordyceps camponoti-floridani TaxID=2030778 RepID=A0A8H4VHA9_9HYPO|nr:CHY zinc finger domain protein [Ophiocordyceps camponoti-floridani]